MLELKTTAPALRPGLVTRGELLCDLESSSAPVIALLAPAGYGKTTVLAQFVARTDRPVAWLSLDQGDGDPTVLISGLAHSLTAAGLISEKSKAIAVASDSALTRGVDQLLESVEVDAKGFLVLDQLDEVPTQSALDVIGAVLTKARDRLQVIVATRSQTALPFGVLRAHGDVFELRGEDLALDVSEAGEIFESLGVTGVSLEQILSDTEGWPAAVYLTGRAIAAGARAAGTGGVRGDDVYLAQYLREEFLTGIDTDLELFLLRSSVLPRMSGDLCDHVLEQDHSAQILNQLQESSLLVTPMDRRRVWYRYHSLLQDYLRSELHGRLAEEEAGLHSRASTWFEENGFVELAIDHARQAGDYGRVVALLSRAARTLYATGRYETLARWLDWLEGTDVLGDYPDLSAVGALARALGGDPGGAERLSRFAYTDSQGHPRKEADLGHLSLMLRAFQAPRGADQALRDAEAAYDVLQHDSEWAHAALGALALSKHAVEGAEAADPLWADALWRSESIEARPMAASARAARTLVAITRGEWDAAADILDGTVEEIEDGGLDLYITSALAYVVAARIAIHNGHLDQGLSYIGAAARIRPLLTVGLPTFSVLTLHQQARAYVEMADIAGARRVMRDAADIVALRPRLGTLIDEHHELKERLAALPAGTVGPSSLTGAELRLLPLLVTHLTYPEIGDRLFISRHTVKTQAMSVFRKLGVSSRSEAVETARQIGLIST